MDKLKSRKFLMCLAAFLLSVATSLSSLASGDEVTLSVGTIAAIIIAAAYAACEAAVDKASVSSTQTQITATSTSKEAVADVIGAINNPKNETEQSKTEQLKTEA